MKAPKKIRQNTYPALVSPILEQVVWQLIQARSVSFILMRPSHPSDHLRRVLSDAIPPLTGSNRAKKVCAVAASWSQPGALGRCFPKSQPGIY